MTLQYSIYFEIIIIFQHVWRYVVRTYIFSRFFVLFSENWRKFWKKSSLSSAKFYNSHFLRKNNDFRFGRLFVNSILEGFSEFSREIKENFWKPSNLCTALINYLHFRRKKFLLGWVVREFIAGNNSGTDRQTNRRQ